VARTALGSVHRPLPVAGGHPSHCQPGPKTEVADWYRSTILQPLWTFAPEHFRSQDFWDAFDRIRVEADPRAPP
jgi:hypothetical protein